MADRVTITQARVAFEAWVAAVGGKTTKQARAAGEPITGTFHLEEQSGIGNGMQIRISQMVNEGGATRDPMGYMRMSPKELVERVRFYLDSVQVTASLAKVAA